MGGPKQKGVITYAVSPSRQRAMKGVFHGYIFNGFSRFMRQAPYVLLPASVGYSVYSWAKTKYEWNNSKEGHHILAQQAGGH
ncbi:hypothetical protein FFLO_01218 [Filobasidium floriforme]|uniref:Cytochrome b-c1 complex subunit 8 n=2 Tax=Filobasidium floriforme TaxID=5210 RepID=A0A8K0JQ64_9TREE|nr:hypothetical protein FFLO_01218 [Filobasidium floriforme]